MQNNASPPAARFLEQALLFTIVAHAAGMVSMALLLLPAMPGGGNLSDASRVAYIAAHPWLWRLGWHSPTVFKKRKAFQNLCELCAFASNFYRRCQVNPIRSLYFGTV
jgi:hypothetical protein